MKRRGVCLCVFLGICPILAFPQEAKCQFPAKEETRASSRSKPPRTDLYGDTLPEGAIARLGTVRFRQDDDHISALAFSPDGKLLASAGGADSWNSPVGEKPYRIYLWDAVTGRELRRFGDLENGIDCIAFSPNGKLLASGGQWLDLWDSVTGRRLRRLAPGRIIGSLAFSPNGKVVAGAEHSTSDGAGIIRLWNVESGKELRNLQPPRGFVDSLAFAMNGRFLVSGSLQGLVCIWDLSRGSELRRFPAGSSHLAVSSDGRTLAHISKRSTVCLVEMETGKQVREWPVDGSYVSAISFSPNDRFLATRAGAICLWQIDTGRALACLNVLPKGNALTFSPDSKTLALGEGNVVTLLDVATKQKHPTQGHECTVLSLAYSPGSEVLVSKSTDGTVCVWKTLTGELIRQYECTTFSSIWFGQEAQIKGLTVEETGARSWDLALGQVERCFPFQAPSKSKRFVAGVSLDGQVIAAGGDTIHVWERVTGKQLSLIPGNDGASLLQHAFLSPAGDTLILATDRIPVQIWDSRSGKKGPSLNFPGWWYNPTHLAFAPNGKLLYTGAADGKLCGWDLASGAEACSCRDLPRPRGRMALLDTEVSCGIAALAMSPDGSLAALASESGTIELWDVASGEKVCTFKHPRHIDAIAFASDGRTIASATSGDYAILVWDVTGLCVDGRMPELRLESNELSSLWAELGSGGPIAFRAKWRLVAGKHRTVSFLAKQLQPEVSARLTELIAALDSDQFEARSKATRELEELRERAEPALRRALAANPSLESRHRIQLILDKLRSQRLQVGRSVAVLEQIGTPEAEALLAKFAQGNAEGWLTQEARVSLRRLATKAGRLTQAP